MGSPQGAEMSASEALHVHLGGPPEARLARDAHRERRRDLQALPTRTYAVMISG